MIELAAKAVGYYVESESKFGLWVYEKNAIPNEDGEYPLINWCPLVDDGDRYRLAKTLAMRVDFATQTVWVGKMLIARWPDDELNDAHAIVRTAAEIGMNMK